MEKSRKSEKTIELHEFYVIRGSGSLPPLCAVRSTGDAFMVTPEQAAVVARVSVRVIFRWLESGAIHFIEGTERSLSASDHCPQPQLNSTNLVSLGKHY